ncbi:MAG: CsbD family protein [Methylococcaceae bacterium]
MSWNRIEGNWKQFKGKIKETWGDLTDDELEEIAGKRDVLLGKIQEKYGIAQEEADKRIKDFEKTLD